MKSMMNKNLATLLVLAATGLPVMAQAADTQKINIKATIAETLSVEPIDEVVFAPTLDALDVPIVITSNLVNSEAKATIEVSADTADKSGNGFKLSEVGKEKTGKLQIDASLADKVFNDGKASISDAAIATPFTLHLTPKLQGTEAAGDYIGHLTVKVSKA